MPDFEVISWQGLCSPAGVPEAVLARIGAALAAALALPDTHKRLADIGVCETASAAARLCHRRH